MSDTDYRECSYCVMDTSDPEIIFDSHGRCNHCREFEQLIGRVWFPDQSGEHKLEQLLDRLRSEGRGREFDCIIGLSGGVDSSYLALKSREWGLRPLVVHIDAGWNSELAVNNIERVVKATGYELHTHVVNWETMRQLQLSYLHAAVANQDVPQDHAFFAGLYHFATKHNVKYVLGGSNVATEGIFPKAWQGPAMDSRNLRAIHKKFGDGKLQGYPSIGMFRYYFWYPLARGMRPIHPLNYLPYSKNEAVDSLVSDVGWRVYERKHGESLFTKFFQNYYLPTKFGYDKRRPHLSSRIAAGEIDRAEAKDELEKPLYNETELLRDKDYLCRKLEIDAEEFDSLMSAPPHDYMDFRNWQSQYNHLKDAQLMARRLTGRRMSIYE